MSEFSRDVAALAVARKDEAANSQLARDHRIPESSAGLALARSRLVNTMYQVLVEAADERSRCSVVGSAEVPSALTGPAEAVRSALGQGVAAWDGPGLAPIPGRRFVQLRGVGHMVMQPLTDDTIDLTEG